MPIKLVRDVEWIGEPTVIYRLGASIFTSCRSIEFHNGLDNMLQTAITDTNNPSNRCVLYLWTSIGSPQMTS